MLDTITLENSLYQTFQPIAGCEVIFVRPDAPRPNSRDYVTLGIQNIRQLGREESSSPDHMGNATMWAHYSVIVEFTGYGPTSKNLLNALQFSLGKDSVIDALWLLDIAVVSHDDTLLDIPVFRDTIWEESSRFNATFHVRVTDTDTVGVIEQVTVTGELDGGVINDPIETSLTIAP